MRGVQPRLWNRIPNTHILLYVQNGSAPLHLASEHGLVQTVELLLEHGANADLENHVCSVDVHVHS